MQYIKNKKLLISLFAFSILTVLLSMAYIKNSPKVIDLSTYKMFLNNEFITKAKIDEKEVIIYTIEDKYSIIKDGINIEELLEKVPVSVKQKNPLLEDLAFLLIIAMVLLIIISYGKKKRALEEQKVQQNMRQTSMELEPMMPSKITPAVSNISFKDVAGIDNVKEELYEIVDFLKNSQKYKSFGIKLPKGVLLIGPPGVGKTMIAKAVAGEANVPFFYQSGASFVQIYVGMGAKRVRELFAYAKKYSPAIIFIDEVDAVGKARGGMRNDERESTLNQLLTEMDGFEDSSGVIVIAATNKIEVLDEALLRAGRFDRRIFIAQPDLFERKEIITIYLEDKFHNVDIDSIAKMTVGFNGASLSTLVNEAAMNALRRGSKEVEESDFLAVKDKVLLGKKKILSFSEEEKNIQATYQAAKALCAYWFEIDFDRVTMMSGSLKDIDREIESKTHMLAKIKVYLAGVAASKLIYNETFSNSTDDILKAKLLASDMVERFGMGEKITPLPTDITVILEDALAEVEKFLEGMKQPLEKIKNILLEKESVSKDELRRVMSDIF